MSDASTRWIFVCRSVIITGRLNPVPPWVPKEETLMSNTPTPSEIDGLRRSVRRWRTLALALLSGLVVVFIVGTTMALVKLQHARQEAHAARQAEMEVRRQAEDARDEATKNLEKARQAVDATRK
jgi:hypothetical protein